jgi:oxygen-independent coproporphyrinogen-3 oxidase
MQPFISVPLTLYVHLPWCVRKCPYCDFNSHELHTELPEQVYIDALLSDLGHDLPAVWGRTVESIFIGGGTPSLFSPAAIDRLLSGLRARLPLRPDLEITLEANPGTVEQHKFSDFRAAGINRLSIGVQSLNDAHLRSLGRIHGRREALLALDTAHHAGFDNFNIDLMYGLPAQTPAQALDDIRAAIALAPAHISHYQLTLEPNTRFYKYPPALPDDDTIWEMQQRCQEQLAIHGYRHYEISAYARPQRRCRHNLNYWQFGDYLGIGAGAHAKLSDAAQLQVRRQWKLKNPRDYLHYVKDQEKLSSSRLVHGQDLVLEFMMNALRLIDGVPASLFSERTGLADHCLQPALNEAIHNGLMSSDNQRLQASSRGLQFLDELLQLFMPEEAPHA